MKRPAHNILIVLAAILALVAGSGAEAGTMTITSAAFANGGRIPIQYTFDDPEGHNISLPLNWTTLPPGTQSFALSMVDQHPMAENFVHWLVIDIPSGITSLAEGASYPNFAMPAGCRELENSAGIPIYIGPFPPPGTGLHPYAITVYALNVASLNLPDDPTLDEFLAAMSGKTLASASLTGYFGYIANPAMDLLLLD